MDPVEKPRISNRVLKSQKENMDIILMIFGSSLNSLGYIFSNENRFHPLTTNMIRGLTSVVICYAIARYRQVDMTFPSPHEYKLEFIRNTLIMIQCLAYAWSQFYLPLPVAITLQATAPIFTTIADRVINGVKINPRQGFWLLIAFIGVLMTANGQWIYQQITGELATADTTFQNYFSQNPQTLMWAAFTLLCVMCIHGVALALTKKLYHDTSLHIMYSQGALFQLVSAVFLPFGWADTNYHIPSMWESFKAAVFMGAPITIGLLAYAQALLMTKNYAMLTPFIFSSIIVGYVVSIVRYGEEINEVCLVGVVTIVVGIIFIVRTRKRFDLYIQILQQQMKGKNNFLILDI